MMRQAPTNFRSVWSPDHSPKRRHCTLAKRPTPAASTEPGSRRQAGHASMGARQESAQGVTLLTRTARPIAHVDQPRNQRLRLVAAKTAFSRASSSDGPKKGPVGLGPVRKFASTLPTLPSPSST